MRRIAFLVIPTLYLLTMACNLAPPPAPVMGSHTSALTLYGKDLYFGAGYCLYRLDTENQVLGEIICVENWTFQRPAIDGKRAYVQVLTSPEEGRFFVAVDLESGTVVWRVDETMYAGADRYAKQYISLINDQVVTLRDRGVDVFDTETGTRIWYDEGPPAQQFQFYDGLLWQPVYRDDYQEKNQHYWEIVGVETETGIVQQTIKLLPYWCFTCFEQLLYIDYEMIVGVDYYYRSNDPQDTQVFKISHTQGITVTWGDTVWMTDLDLDSAISQSVIYDDLLVVAGYDKVYAVDLNTGEVEWSFHTEAAKDATNDVEHILPFFLRDFEKPTLYGLDANSGAMIWQYRVSGNHGMYDGYGSSPVVLPVLNDGTVYIANKNTIDALDLNTGELQWQVEIDSDYEYYFFHY
ncbi:MAG: PQQ-binding-like beta-propeller repeat protein [Proteobacteria bacterium]|nr:PQQ-binding-like beta-propeller repeat protein [Pseudomonadota bacterium]